MKRIVALCGSKPDSPNLVKIRLRGKGSGFKEGPENKESTDPLHICVSSKCKEKYEIAVKCVSDLLEQAYNDYALFLKRRGKRARKLSVEKI